MKLTKSHKPFVRHISMYKNNGLTFLTKSTKKKETSGVFIRHENTQVFYVSL
jgi:hypothetical protein